MTLLLKKLEATFKRWTYLPVIIGCCIGVGLSVGAAGMVSKWEKSSRQAKFERQADNLVNILQRNLDKYSQITRLLGGFYESSRSVSQQEFKQMSQNILPFNRSIIGVGWAGDPSIIGVGWAAKKQGKNFSIAYIEPTKLKPPFVRGYNLYSNKNYQTAIEKAKQTRVMVQIRENQNSSKFIIYNPVYQKKNSNNTTKELFRGVVFTVYDLEQMIQTSIKANELDRLNFYLYNTSVDRVQSFLMKPNLDRSTNFILSYNKKTQKIIKNKQSALAKRAEENCYFDLEWFKCLRSLNIAKDEWSLLILPDGKLKTDRDSAIFTLAIGLIATSALVIYLWMSIQLQKSYSALEKVNLALEQSNLDLENRVRERTRELTQAKEEAETANKAKDKFLVNISHELRTPLNAVIGYANILLRDSNLKSEGILGLRIIKQSGAHLLTLINDLLDFSKMGANKMVLDPKPLHLSTFIEEIVGIVEMRAKEKGVLFRYEMGTNLPSAIEADETRLRQVLLNLLSNAVKFTDSGKVTLKVTQRDSEIYRQIEGFRGYSGVNLTKSTVPNTLKTKIRFEVTDTGVGIGPSELGKIFQPFEQVGEVSRRAQGTGLGLSISAQLVQLMGSKIQVSSYLGVGSTFWFDAIFNKIYILEESRKKRSNRQLVGYKGRDLHKILIVDDRQENRDILLALLKPLGFKLTEASDGKEGLEMACSVVPDLILTDMFMPRKTGLTMVLELRQMPKFQKTPIISLSASTSEIVQKKSTAVGCDAFVQKPIDEDELLKLLQKYLRIEWVYEFVKR